MFLVRFEDISSGSLIGDRIEVADTSMLRLVGLLKRKQLLAGEGLWIKPSSGVHTIGMRFPIDVIGLDRNFVIVKLWRALQPFRVTAMHWKIGSVLELPAGTIDSTNTQVSDRLRFHTSEANGDYT